MQQQAAPQALDGKPSVPACGGQVAKEKQLIRCGIHQMVEQGALPI